MADAAHYHELASSAPLSNSPSIRILSITPDVKEAYFDFHVPGTNNYWAGGIWHHNCGKTTYAHEMGKRLNLYLGEEPVSGNPFLTKFYQDPKAFAFPMQIYLLKERFKTQLHAATIAIGAGDWNGAILDRSISGDRVFAKMHYECGNIDVDAWQAYEDFHMLMCTNLLPPTRIIRLQCEPETAFERIKARGRAVESGITLDYLKALEAGYQQLWHEIDQGLLPWGHRIKVETFHWDPMSQMPNWDRHAQSLARSCGIPYTAPENPHTVL